MEPSRPRIEPSGHRIESPAAGAVLATSTSARAAWLLATLATLAFELAHAAGPRFPAAHFAHLAVVLALGAAVAWGPFGALGGRGRTLSAAAALFLLGMFAAPFAVDAITRWIGVGEPLEIQFAYALRNLMIGLTALRARRECQRWGALLSLFLTLFAFLLNFTPGVSIAAALYFFAGVWWLMGSYWERLQGRLPSATRREIPRGGLALILVSACALLTGAVFTSRAAPTTSALWGLVPASGGDGAADPFARGGVGDGDDMVAAQDDARGFGPVDSDLFLEDQAPSLYDMFNDAYNPPAPRREQSKRAIPLGGRNTPHSHQKKSSHEKSGRQFSAARRPFQGARKTPADTKSPAVFQVVGRTPLHLRVETYNGWNGRDLTFTPDENDAPSPAARAFRLEGAGAARWARWDAAPPPSEPAENGDAPWDAVPRSRVERHALRFIHWKSNRVPTPAAPRGVSADHLHDARFFGFTPDDALEMPGVDAIPALSVLRLEHLVRAPTTLAPAADALADASDESLASAHDPDGVIDPRTRALARDWTRGLAPGWPRVEAVCGRLRRDYTHDPHAAAPADCDDAAAHFLFESRRGPDYLFAAAAALLLREAGLRARVASGYYASPRNRDRRSGVTNVHARDVHFWVEASLDGRNWFTVEPTPGYDVLTPPRSWPQWLAEVGRMAWRLLARRWPGLALAGVALAAAWALRRRAAALLADAWCRCAAAAAPRQRVLQTLWLLETQARLAGAGRPRGHTLARWARDWPAAARARHAELLARFVRLAHWAAYAERAECPESAGEARAVCRQVVSALRWRHWRAARRVPARSEPPDPLSA